MTEREKILTALETWIKQRPGLEFGNYGDVSSYRAELRGITRDLRHARTLLNYVWRRESITAEMLKDSFSRAFSGRLQWQEESKCEGCGKTFWSDYNRAPGTTGACKCTAAGAGANRVKTGAGRLEYSTGQYWPTEYRRAACAVLASAIWSWLRDNMPEPDAAPEGADRTYRGKSAGDYLRSTARRELGATIQKRWFN